MSQAETECRAQQLWPMTSCLDRHLQPQLDVKSSGTRRTDSTQSGVGLLLSSCWSSAFTNLLLQLELNEPGDRPSPAVPSGEPRSSLPLHISTYSTFGESLSVAHVTHTAHVLTTWSSLWPVSFFNEQSINRLFEQIISPLLVLSTQGRLSRYLLSHGTTTNNRSPTPLGGSKWYYSLPLERSEQV